MTRTSTESHPQSATASAPDLPQVELKGANVVVNGKRLSLSRKARALRVVKAFFANSKPSLSAGEILDVLNREDGLPAGVSPRARKYQHGALVRMVSRIRDDFNQAFNELMPPGLSWFHYDRTKNHWVLFKMPSQGADGLTY